MRILSVCSVVGLAATVLALAPIYRFDGLARGNALGSAVACIGDADGDGLPDFAAGAPNDSTNGAGAGAVVVYSGANGAVLATISGEAPGDAFGAALAAAGDVDGDGCGDWIGGAPGADANGADAGRARVVSGKTGAVLHTLDGDAAGDALGTAVAGAGDVDDDGYADVIAGAPGNDANGAAAGRARVVAGKNGAVLHTFDGDAAGDALGSSVAGAGDADGDGYDDVAVGSPGNDANGVEAGRAHVRSGRDGALLHVFDGAAAGDRFGKAVAGIGDANGDGMDDVAIGAPGDAVNGADAGSVEVRSGATGAVLHLLRGKRPLTLFGEAVAAAGDVDGDGAGDVAIGAPGYDRRGAVDCGAVHVFSGGTGHLLLTRFGSAASDALGSAVAGRGDVNRDGYADVIAGAPGADNNGPSSGSAQVHGQRPFAGLVDAVTHSPATTNAAFGFRIVDVGDLTNDGIQEYAISAPFDAPNVQGSVRIYSGADHSLFRTHPGPAQTGTWFGQTVATVGDLNHDSKQEIVVGAFHWDLSASVLDVGRAEIYDGATGALFRAYNGQAQADHMGSSAAGLGDVNGDGFDDYVIALGQKNNYVGQVWTFSGATTNRVLAMTYNGNAVGEWYGWAMSALGDIDGDGVNDFGVGGPAEAVPPGNGYVTVISGRTGVLIRRLDGIAPSDRFGWSIAAGDVNGDGVPDVIVGAYQHDPSALQDAGMVRVHSGQDWSVLHDVFGGAASEKLGDHVAGPGDVNGDGYDDFMGGAPGFTRLAPTVGLNIGHVMLWSGYDGRVLAEYEGVQWFDSLRICAGIGDLNGDGLADVAVGAPAADTTAGIDAGFARLLVTVRGSDPGRAETYGNPCAGSNGKLPRLGVDGRPVLGQVFATTLRAAPFSTLAIWNLGAVQSAIPLAVIQAPGCTALTLPVVPLAAATNAAGRATFPAPVPVDQTLVGLTLRVQWVMIDLLANPLGVILSDAGSVTIGR